MTLSLTRQCSRVRFGDPDNDNSTMTGFSEPKPGQALKRLGPHDLVTPVPGFEDRVFHLVLGPGQRSLTLEVKKEPILYSYFYENTCLCMLSARNKVQN